MKKLRETELTLPPTYNPKGLLENLASHLNTDSGYALAMALDLPPATISKIKNRHANVTAGVLLRMHDVSKVPVDTLRQWMGMDAFSMNEKVRQVRPAQAE